MPASLHSAHAAYLRHLGSQAETFERDNVFAVRTGIDSNTENGVVSTGAVSEALAREAIAWLGDVPASWLCDDDGTASVLAAVGCRAENDGWEMHGPVVAREVAADVRRVADGRWAAFDGGRRVGEAAAFFTDDVVLLLSVAVVPDARRRGFGRALAQARLNEAHARGCTTAVLAPSPDGRKLYESLGFTARREPPNRWFYVATKPIET